jgi:hypothetical protein
MAHEKAKSIEIVTLVASLLSPAIVLIGGYYLNGRIDNQLNASLQELAEVHKSLAEIELSHSELSQKLSTDKTIAENTKLAIDLIKSVSPEVMLMASTQHKPYREQGYVFIPIEIKNIGNHPVNWKCTDIIIVGAGTINSTATNDENIASEWSCPGGMIPPGTTLENRLRSKLTHQMNSFDYKVTITISTPEYLRVLVENMATDMDLNPTSVPKEKSFNYYHTNAKLINPSKE